MARVKTEQRRFMRIPKQSKIRYQELKFPMKDSDLKDTKMKNFGGGGILFVSKKKINKGAVLKLDITAQGWEKHRPGFIKVEKTSISKPITAIGEVVRTEKIKNGEYDVAVKFTNIHEDDFQGLIGYIEKYKE